MGEDLSEFQQLLVAAQEGDNEALARLAEQYEPELRIVARVRLGPALRAHLDSVDLVQSVHRSLMIGLRDNRFDISSPRNLVALALTMVRRKVARHWRRIQRQQRLSRMGSPASDAGVPQLLAELSTKERAPESVAVYKERVEQVFDQLNDQERKLIELRMAGCTTAEAARTLGLDPDVTRVQLNRLRKRLERAGISSELL